MEVQMLSSILRSLSSALLVLCFATSAMANDVFIYYKNSGSDATTSQYNNLKSILENLGFTVSSSTSGTVSSTDVSGYDLVIDMTGTSNCGSTCKSVYDSYVSGGGKLLIAGVNGATNRNTSIEALIENKMGVGSFTLVGGCNSCYGSYAVVDYASSTSSENTLPGPDKLFAANGGTAVAANSTSSSWNTWYKWDYGSNGGSVYVTFGYGQFLSTHTYASNMVIFITAIMVEEGLYTTNTSSSTPIPVYGSSGPTTSQQSRIDAKLALAAQGQGNTVEALIFGDDNDINITQAGGPSYILLSILGNLNTFDSEQNLTAGAHGYIEATIIGDTNDVDIIQQGTGDKAAFVNITGDSNTANVNQKDSGTHFVDLSITGDNHIVDVLQEGSGDHSATVELDGTQPWDFDLTQSGATDHTYTLPHAMSDGSSVSGTCAAVGGCNLTIVQQ
jgi:hypothetical protein